MNRGYIRTLARKRLGETTAAFWTDAELNGYINDGIQDIAFRTKSIKTGPTQFNAYADQALYGLQANLPLCLAITELYYYNILTLKWIKLRSTSRTELDETNPGWLSAPSALPNQFWWDRELDKVYLYPPPQSQYISANCVQAYYAIQSTDLASDQDIPQIPQPIHLAVIDYVVAYSFESRGWGDKANDAWNKYRTRLSDYDVERGREREDDNVIMKGYKNRIKS